MPSSSTLRTGMPLLQPGVVGSSQVRTELIQYLPRMSDDVSSCPVADSLSEVLNEAVTLIVMEALSPPNVQRRQNLVVPDLQCFLRDCCRSRWAWNGAGSIGGYANREEGGHRCHAGSTVRGG